MFYFILHNYNYTKYIIENIFIYLHVFESITKTEHINYELKLR